MQHCSRQGFQLRHLPKTQLPSLAPPLQWGSDPNYGTWTLSPGSLPSSRKLRRSSSLMSCVLQVYYGKSIRFKHDLTVSTSSGCSNCTESTMKEFGRRTADITIKAACFWFARERGGSILKSCRLLREQ